MTSFLLRGRAWLAGAASAVLGAVLLVAGCGGGVGVGGTGAYASGPITGFGSIIVNGIEFDEAAARIEDDDGAALARGNLRLGMFVEVESGAVDTAGAVPLAVASRVRIASQAIGPVASVDTAGASLVVLGQTVAVTAATVFDETLSGGLAGVAAGAVVQVWGSYDAATGRIVATRIGPASAGAYMVRGTVGSIDPAGRTFTIGAAQFSYTGAPAGLAVGAFLRVQVETVPGNGRWAVRSLGEGRRNAPDTARARLRGLVTAFTSARAFSVDGQPVDASAAAFPDGEAGVVRGARVEVEGPIEGGTLRATQVRLVDEVDPTGGFELKGEIGQHRPALQTFVLRGVTVFYGAPAVRFEDGTAADLADGRRVEVRGVLSDGGTRLLATRVRIKS